MANKRVSAMREKVIAGRPYALSEAVDLLKEIAAQDKTKVKFDQSVELAVNLGIDAKKSDQAVRGATTLPHGSGKNVRVAVFAEGEAADSAKAAGADIVGFEDLAEDIKAGNMNFDVLIATPKAMSLIGKLGQILGPKGLMPNPKVGTVTPNPAEAVKNAKAGQARYRTDKAGIIHCAIGKVAFESQAIMDNLHALVQDLRKAKPKTAKGVYFKKITLSSTMGPGILLDLSTVSGLV